MTIHDIKTLDKFLGGILIGFIFGIIAINTTFSLILGVIVTGIILFMSILIEIIQSQHKFTSLLSKMLYAGITVLSTCIPLWLIILGSGRMY